MADANGGAIFTSGDDLTGAFQGAGLIPDGQPDAGAPAGGVAAWNTALAGANDFFDFTVDPAGDGEVVNLVYILSASEGADQASPDDRPLADEITDLQGAHNAVVDAIIFNETTADNQFLTAILASAGGADIALVESQADLDEQLLTPFLEILEIV